MFPKDFMYSSLIDLMGEEINILKRAETVGDDGEVTYTYNQTIDTMAWIREVGGYITFWDSPGYTKDVDLAGCFYHNENIDIGDMVVRENSKKFEVTQIIERKSGKDTDFLEVVMVGIE